MYPISFMASRNASQAGFVVLDTPPASEALDFLDAPRRLLDLLNSRAVTLLGAPAGLLRQFRLVDLAARAVLAAFDRVTGLNLLADVQAFVSGFEGMYEGFAERAKRADAILRAGDTALVVRAGKFGERWEEICRAYSRQRIGMSSALLENDVAIHTGLAERGFVFVVLRLHRNVYHNVMATNVDLFPWQYFECPTDSAAEAVVRWIYSEFSFRAYRGFLEQGRGLLVGPFLTGDSRDLITAEEFVERRKMNREVAMTVVFVAMNSPVFENTLPDATACQGVRARLEPEFSVDIKPMQDEAELPFSLHATKSMRLILPDMQACADGLCNIPQEAGSRDNLSCVMMEVVEGT